ncbi:MAG: hypothetical protein R3D45_01710 [Rhizobiaceae bacterium]
MNQLTGQAFHGDPFPVFAELRRRGPLVRMKIPIIGWAWPTTTHSAAEPDTLPWRRRFDMSALTRLPVATG